MRILLAALCAAVLCAAAAFAGEPAPADSAQAPKPGRPAAERAADIQAAKDSVQEELTKVGVEGKSMEAKVDTVVACKMKAGKVADCDPANMKDPKTNKSVLNSIKEKVMIDKAWKAKLKDEAGKTLNPAR